MKVERQMNTGVVHLSNTFFHERIILPKKLYQTTFATKVYFLNSSTEVVQMAIKTCCKYYDDIKK